MNFEACLTSVISIKNEIKSFLSQKPNLQTALAEIAKLQPMFKELLSSCSFKPFFLDYNPNFLNDDVANSDVPPPPANQNELPAGDKLTQEDDSAPTNLPRDRPTEEKKPLQLNIFKCMGAAANLAGPVAQIISAANRKDVDTIVNSLNSVVNALEGVVDGCFKK